MMYTPAQVLDPVIAEIDKLIKESEAMLEMWKIIAGPCVNDPDLVSQYEGIQHHIGGMDEVKDMLISRKNSLSILR